MTDIELYWENGDALDAAVDAAVGVRWEAHTLVSVKGDNWTLAVHFAFDDKADVPVPHPDDRTIEVTL